jgi:predicted nucleic acid-binding protein
MTTSWLIDSNVLVYAFFHKPGEEDRQDAETRLRLDSRRVLTLAAEGKLSAAVAQQNLLEFLAVITSPKRVTSPVGLPEALRACEAYLSFCFLTTPKSSTYLAFQTLTTQWRGARERLFDLYLGATALDNDLSHICTWNSKHFRGLPGLTAATPSHLISSLAKGR